MKLVYSHGGPTFSNPDGPENGATYCGVSILIASRCVGWYFGDNPTIGIGKMAGPICSGCRDNSLRFLCF